MFPIYINRAAESKDPVERMKLFVTAVISAFYYMNMFSKPVPAPLFSSIPSSERHWKAATQMAPRYTASKYRIIRL